MTQNVIQKMLIVKQGGFERRKTLSLSTNRPPFTMKMNLLVVVFTLMAALVMSKDLAVKRTPNNDECKECWSRCKDEGKSDSFCKWDCDCPQSRELKDLPAKRTPNNDECKECWSRCKDEGKSDSFCKWDCDCPQSRELKDLPAKRTPNNDECKECWSRCKDEGKSDSFCKWDCDCPQSRELKDLPAKQNDDD
ncbi:uncharacterized protein [Acropora muricata]|uniref:uncharacterized protein isoform X3 n=1 Tax=Acropora muricata TaxID=159855 RepID=UPI0034E465BD